MGQKAAVVVVVGNIGSGKSTVTPIVASGLNAKLIDADNLFQTTNPFRDRYLKHTKRWALANELWMTLERVRLLHHYRQYKRKNVVIDSGILMSWAYTYGHFLSGILSKEEWQVYKRLFDKLVDNAFGDLTVVALECSVETLLKRIKKRGRKFEIEYYTPIYLQRINRGLKELRQKLEREGARVTVFKEEDLKGLLNQEKIQAGVVERVLVQINR